MDQIVLIRGGGDLASAVIHKLYRSGFRVVVCDLEKPACVRRTVSFCNAIYEGDWEIEGVRSRFIQDPADILPTLDQGLIPVLIQPDREIRDLIKPQVFIDATLAKRTPDYDLSWAPLVIGLGPGIEAGKHAHVVIETKRGHYLGRLIQEGEAIANSGIPGTIAGVDKDRVLRAPAEGRAIHRREIGDLVEADEVILTVDDQEVRTVIPGIVRGLIADGYPVKKGQKIGDIDPRGQSDYVKTISDKGRTIAGGVLEAIISRIHGGALDGMDGKG